MGAAHRREEGALHRARPAAGLLVASVEQDFEDSFGLRTEAQLIDVDQMGLH